MMPDNPLISIGMPVYNVEATIHAAIRSIQLQTYSNWELIITDDGSNDRTVEFIRGLRDSRIRLQCDGQHKSVPQRLNEAIRSSQGEYFARMDGDDISYPERLAQQLTYLREHPETDLVGAWMLVFGRAGVALGKRAKTLGSVWRYRTMFETVPLAHPTFFGKMIWFKKHGYPEWSTHFQDQQLLYQTLHNAHLGVVPQILLGYREEGLSIRKQLRYRLSYLHSFDSLRKSIGFPRATLALVAQASKFAFEALAIGTGLEYKLLRHRVQRLTPEERRIWDVVWRTVNEHATQ
jgi:glycosyltransferase involved in cell wall biosynthesis